VFVDVSVNRNIHALIGSIQDQRAVHPVTIVDLIRTEVVTAPELRVDNAPFIFSYEMRSEA